LAKLRQHQNAVSFLCPGCGDHHTINTDRWTWNGSMDAPTFTPSLLVRSGHYASSHQPGDPCWCGKDYGFSCYLCHSFITDGKIAFLGDCTHPFAGQTLNLVDVTETANG